MVRGLKAKPLLERHMSLNKNFSSVAFVGYTLLLALVLSLGWACTKHDTDFGNTGPIIKQDTLVARDTAKPVDTLRFATLNMSIGFPVSQLLFKDMQNPEVSYRVLDTLYQRYLQGRPNDRIKAMADTITALNLDVVGLQEVMKISKNGALANDFLPELVAAIKSAGGPAYQIFSIPLNDTLLKGQQGLLTNSVAFHEGNAFLVKPTLQILDTAKFIYFSLLPIVTADGKDTERALGYLKFKSPRGVIWQVFNTHLEVFADFSSSQAKELRFLVDSLALKDGKGNFAAPLVVLGDFNVLPQVGAHNVMTEGGFVDLYTPKPDLGVTCCVAGSALWSPDTSFSDRRLDYFFGKHLVRVLDHEVALKGPVMTANMVRILASDHRMVWTRIVGQ
jgi:endonuclease/exonuclease/phosphatase family metal-dependent hydrolase